MEYEGYVNLVPTRLLASTITELKMLLLLLVPIIYHHL
jgi:hypothetical protein